MTTLTEALEQYATAITDTTESKAYADGRKALANRPCLLFGPPTLNYAGTGGGTLCGPAVGLQVFALSTYRAPAIEALDELEQLIEDANEVLDILTAEPIQYPAGDGSLIAAYRLTTTDYPL